MRHEHETAPEAIDQLAVVIGNGQTRRQNGFVVELQPVRALHQM
jgi:hypothetical protein